VVHAERFSTSAGLAKLAEKWPAARLVEIWNSLVFIPGDVAGMRTGEQGVPFLLRQFSLAEPVQHLARASLPVHEGSCVAGVMQHEQGVAEVQFLPKQLPFLWSASQPPRKQ
jgi:hypothetical protein